MIRVYVTVLSLCLVAIVTDSFQQKPPHGLGAVARTQCSGPDGSTPLLLSKAIDSKTNSVDHVCVMLDGDEDTEPFREDARTIADALGIPLLSAPDGGVREEFKTGEFTHALRLVPYEYEDEISTFALAIEPIQIDAVEERKGRKRNATRKPKKPKPSSSSSSSSAFFVDLYPPPNSKAGRRSSGASGTSDLLVKAVGPRKGPVGSNGSRERAVVWDLTAGLGQDSLVLARNGAKRVRMVERHPIVAALLRDAIRRLELLAVMPPSEPQPNCATTATSSSPATNPKNPAKDLLETLSFSFGEAIDVLHRKDCSGCDVVYLDPMFPARRKQSAVKKGMSMLHGLLETHVASSSSGDDTQVRDTRQQEEQDLLTTAIDAAKLRVVVKRPIKAPLLGDGSTKPSHAIAGSVNRWDVYVKPPLPSASEWKCRSR